MAFDHKTYDRRRYADFKSRRAAVIALLGGKCYLCEQEAGEEIHLHHKEYHPVESAYPRHARSLWNRLRRVKEAEEHPERFALLCPKCHKTVERANEIGNYKWLNKKHTPEEFKEKLKTLLVTKKVTDVTKKVTLDTPF